ncbi:hypothetical protein Tco_1354874 [Tanacetum coccineum]
MTEEKIRTQEVLDLEDMRREKRGNKEWQEVRNTRANERSLHALKENGKSEKGAYVGIVRDNKYKEVHCVRECELSYIVTEKDIRRLKSCNLLALVRDKKGWAGLHDIDAVWVCLLIVAELVFMGKEDRNCIPRRLVTLVEDLDAWNDYPWGEYMWAKFYEMTVNIDSIPIVNLDPTPAEKIQSWFDSSIPFFNGIVDEDGKGCGDDSVLVSKDNSVDEDYNVCEDASAGLSKDEIINDKLVDEDCNMCEDASAGLSKDNAVNENFVGNNDQLLLEDGDGLFDSEAGCRNSEEDNENQPANVSIHDLYAVVKVHEERIANLERLLKEKQPNDYAAENAKPNMIPNHSDDIPSCSVPDLNSNQTGVDQELGGAANDPMSICSRPDMHYAKVGCDGMAIDKPDQMNDYNFSQPILASVDDLIQACAYAADHPELDVLQHEAHVNRSGPKINQHPTAEPLTDEINKSKYVNVVKADYKPPLETVFAANIKSNKKKCGLQKKYVLRSIQERKKRLAMTRGSPYAQLGTTTTVSPKTRSMTSIGDTIVALEFEVVQ